MPADQHRTSSAIEIETIDGNAPWPLCEECKQLFLGPNVTALLRGPSEDALRIKRGNVSMLRSAVNGCNLCRELLCMPFNFKYQGQKIREESGASYIANWPIGPWQNRLRRQEKDERELEKQIEFSFELYDGGVRVTRMGKPASEPGSTSLLFNIGTSFDDVAAVDIEFRHIRVNVFGQKIASHVQTLMTECDTGHQRCHSMRKEVPSRPPSRLLNVSPLYRNKQEHINLEEIPHSSQGLQYAALSYRWGAPQPNATKTQNYNVYLNQILLSSLPQAIIGAVKITRRLGLKYLWVDSLCIQQDSTIDITNELSRMGSIYSNSSITIAASSAVNCNQQILSRHLPKRPMNFRYRTSSGAIGSISLYRSGTIDYPLTEPVGSRAWIFQEYFMAPRILILSKYQVSYICKENSWYDHSLASMHRNRRTKSRRVDLSFPGDWTLLLQQFSRREMSNPVDKLPAIGSIAAYFSPRANGPYLAGIWQSDVHAQLLWSATSQNVLQKPDKWRAPSWSPLAVDGDIRFHVTRINFPDLEIVRAVVTPLSPLVPFGQIREGYLTAKARVVKVLHFHPLYDSLDDGFKFKSWDTFIGETPPVDLPSVFCLLIGWQTKAGQAYGLFVKELDVDCYTRLGLFMIDKSASEELIASFMKAEQKVIRLV
ncbi:HET-domain-containing protein [Microthyrium microscopicum]|uniref:HET-domain-containing protein n=1 Tax=Microthyrium microscopicum TaxID=703497 RepID=A0A6A6TXS7_9PEZI|nr:HET-domain-containing protein [Microthyrium microscopicum]